MLSSCLTRLQGHVPVSASLCISVALSVTITQVLPGLSIVGRRALPCLPGTYWLVTKDTSSGSRCPASLCAVTMLTPQHAGPRMPAVSADGLEVKLGCHSSLLACVHRGCGFLPTRLGDPGPSASNSADLTAGEGCQAPPPWARSAAGLKELVCLQLHLAMKVASDLTRDHVPSPDILELLKVSQHHRQDPAASPNHCLTLTPPHLCDGTR